MQINLWLAGHISSEKIWLNNASTLARQRTYNIVIVIEYKGAILWGRNIHFCTAFHWKWLKARIKKPSQLNNHLFSVWFGFICHWRSLKLKILSNLNMWYSTQYCVCWLSNSDNLFYNFKSTFSYIKQKIKSVLTTATSCLVIRSTGIRLEMTCVKKNPRKQW